jgi:hypothetical protein
VASADRHYRRAREASIALGSPTFESLTCTSHAQLLLAVGRSEQRAEAAQLLARAQLLGERSEIAAITIACQLLIAQHGLDQSAGKVIPLQSSRRGSRA